MPSTFWSKKDNFITTDACNTGLGRPYGKEKANFLDPWPSQVDSSPIAKRNMP